MIPNFSPVTNLQRQITEELDLDLSNYGDETRRASEIYTMLSQKKRHVLILDDLWQTLPLEKVGIPEPTRFNGCKCKFSKQNCILDCLEQRIHHTNI
ncbi:hypothetical protein ACSBR2_019058 [Camellia fascicularis]